MIGLPTQFGAAQKTFLLSCGLLVATAALTLGTRSTPIVATKVPAVVAAVVLGGLFFLAEQFLLNVEFRRQAHSLTLAGIPLTLGLLVGPPHTLLLARIVGSCLALLVQRVRWDKILYNLAAYVFEVSLAVTTTQLIIGQRAHLDLASVAILIGLVAAGDQIMSMLVLYVIRLHNGPLSRREMLGVLGPAALLSTVTSAFVCILVLLAQTGLLGGVLDLFLIVLLATAYREYLVTNRRHQALALVHGFVAEGVGAPTVEALTQHLLVRIRLLLRAARVELAIPDVSPTEPSVTAAPAEPPPGTGAAIVVFSVDEDDLVRVAHRQFDHSNWVVSLAVNQGEPTLAPRTTKNRALRGWLSERGMRDAIVVPLLAAAELTGTLSVIDRLGETATFTPDDVALLQTLTGHLSVALRNATLIEKLGYEASHDSLTGVANRTYLTQRMKAALLDGPHRTGILLLDLDRFKEVNDALGHDVGDRLLQVVADRLQAAVPPSATVARLGGDEFAVLLPALDDGVTQMRGIAHRITTALAEPIQFREAILTPEASIGLAVSTGPDSDLLRRADTAMYVAKNLDERLSVFTPEMDRGRIERLALLADLRSALDVNPDQLVVHYQPKIEVAQGRARGVEALVRWNHPTLGVLAPDRFIPLAESTGLIERLTQCVLATALADCYEWTARGHRLTVAVNVSARNVGDRALPGRVAEALRVAQVPASSLVLEITESSIMADPEQTLPVLNQLAALGVEMSLDDFGTGYSSLSYLQRLPVSEVKIDRSFVVGLSSADAANSQALIRSITGLCANLGLRVVAEGVETQAQLTELRDLGCHIAQGFYISRPISAADLDVWLGHYQGTRGGRLSLVTPAV